MDYLFALGGLFIAHMLALISPGPNVIIITQTAMVYNRRAGILVAAGLATGAAIWSSMALVGLNVVFAYVTWLYGVVRFAGGVYLIYLGIKFWRAANQGISEPVRDGKMLRSSWQFYRIGLLTTLTNPKPGSFLGVFLLLYCHLNHLCGSKARPSA